MSINITEILQKYFLNKNFEENSSFYNFNSHFCNISRQIFYVYKNTVNCREIFSKFRDFSCWHYFYIWHGKYNRFFICIKEDVFVKSLLSFQNIWQKVNSKGIICMHSCDVNFFLPMCLFIENLADAIRAADLAAFYIDAICRSERSTKTEETVAEQAFFSSVVLILKHYWKYLKIYNLCNNFISWEIVLKCFFI